MNPNSLNKGMSEHRYAAAAKSLSDSVRPHGLQPTRFLRPWDSPGKNTGVGCHFLLQCMEVESESEVLSHDPMLTSIPYFDGQLLKTLEYCKT